MQQCLAQKNILLGVTGSIAAYKSAELVRRLREAGATVRVAMTQNAKQFITPLTMQAVSGHPVHDDLFDVQAEAGMGHIELARWADVVLVAPATASFMARLAVGMADDLLTSVCLATKAKIAVAPAMNQGMWQHTLTSMNQQALEQKGIYFFGPDEGSQACGDFGLGRLLEPLAIVQKVVALFANGLLAGKRVLLTGGPTHEAIDPVRFIANGSSGKMAYALACAAREAGASVKLISGPVALPPPSHIDYISVVSAQEMYDAVMRNIADCDIFLAVAAVGDYRVETIAQQKIHRKANPFTLSLIQNPDIVASVAELATKPFVVGFAAETENLMERAAAKRQDKKLDMVVANLVGEGLGIGSDDNAVVVQSEHHQVSLPRTSKTKLARQVISLIASEYQQRKTT